MDNSQVTNMFREIAQMLELRGDNPFRIRAYERAARNIEDLGEKLENISARGELTAIAGVGSDLAKKIEEIISKGSLKYYEELKKSIPKGIFLMFQIPGLGPKKVKLFYDKLKIDSIEKLEKSARAGSLSKLEGIKSKTESNILRGIDIFKKSKERILINLALDIAGEFVSKMKGIKEVERLELAGSLRRRKETIKDIDILAISDKPSVVMDKFSKLSLVDQVIAKGVSKASVIAKRSNMQVDLRVLKRKSFGSAWLYFTGSKEFNIKLRGLAAKRGYKINEYGVFSTAPGVGVEKSLAGRSEEQIFSLLNMAYIPPELREDRGEIEAALANKLPKLIELADIKGDLHAHSDYSDGENSIEEMAQAAKKLGYEYIGIADHSQSLKIAKGLSVKKLYKKIEEVKKIDKKISAIKVLCGSEVDILADGSLDYPDKVLKELDFVIAAIHGGFKQSKVQLTRRIVSACKNKYVSIIAHPTGMLWGVRDAYELDFDEVFRAARSQNVALEINCHPHRLDLNDIYAMRARQAGIKLCLNADAHIIESLDFIELGLGVARRSWLTKKDVVNCMKLEQLWEWLKK